MITHKRMYLILCILHEICYITAFNTNQKIVAHVCNNSQEYFEISEVNQNSCLTKEKLIETPSYSNATIFYKKDEVDITGYQCKYSASLYIYYCGVCFDVARCAFTPIIRKIQSPFIQKDVCENFFNTDNLLFSLNFLGLDAHFHQYTQAKSATIVRVIVGSLDADGSCSNRKLFKYEDENYKNSVVKMILKIERIKVKMVYFPNKGNAIIGNSFTINTEDINKGYVINKDNTLYFDISSLENCNNNFFETKALKNYKVIRTEEKQNFVFKGEDNNTLFFENRGLYTICYHQQLFRTQIRNVFICINCSINSTAELQPDTSNRLLDNEVQLHGYKYSMSYFIDGNFLAIKNHICLMHTFLHNKFPEYFSFIMEKQLGIQASKSGNLNTYKRCQKVFVTLNNNEKYNCTEFLPVIYNNSNYYLEPTTTILYKETNVCKTHKINKYLLSTSNNETILVCHPDILKCNFPFINSSLYPLEISKLKYIQLKSIFDESDYNKFLQWKTNLTNFKEFTVKTSQYDENGGQGTFVIDNIPTIPSFDFSYLNIFHYFKNINMKEIFEKWCIYNMFLYMSFLTIFNMFEICKTNASNSIIFIVFSLLISIFIPSISYIIMILKKAKNGTSITFNLKTTASQV